MPQGSCPSILPVGLKKNTVACSRETELTRRHVNFDGPVGKAQWILGNAEESGVFGDVSDDQGPPGRTFVGSDLLVVINYHILGAITMLGSIAKLPPRIHFTCGFGFPVALQNTVMADPGSMSMTVVPFVPRPPADTMM